MQKPEKIGDQTFESIHDLARQYQITATIAPDGKGSAIWKPRENW